MCSLTSPNRIRSQREKELDQREGDQIREKETRSEAARPGSRDPGRRSQREKELDQREGDQIRERETRSEAARLGSRDLGRAASGGLGRVTWVAWPGACATQAARLARPEVHCGLGGFDFCWVFSSSSFFFFFSSGSDFIFAGDDFLLYIGL